MVDTPFLRSLVPSVGSLARPKQITTNFIPPVADVGDVLGGILGKAKDLTLAYPKKVLRPAPQDPNWKSAGGPGYATPGATTQPVPTTPGAATSMQFPVRQTGAHDRVTAWDTDPKYQVINKLTQEEFSKPFESKNAEQIVKDVTEIVIKKVGESGFKITPEFEAWMRENARSATAEWAQAQKESGKEHLMAADYYMMMAEFAITGAQQFAAPPAETTPTTESPPEGTTPTESQTVDGTEMSDEEIQQVYLVWATNRQQSQPGEPVDFQSFLDWLDEQEAGDE